MTSQSTSALAKAFCALRLMRAARRDAGFTIISTRPILLGVNLTAVAALMNSQGLCEPAFPDSRGRRRRDGLCACTRTPACVGVCQGLLNARGGDRTRMGSYPKGF